MINNRRPALRALWVGLVAAIAIGAVVAQVPVTSARGSSFIVPFSFAFGTETIAAEEGLVYVPENRAKSGSRTIAVHFLRVPGRDRSLPPIVYLPGGPGDSITRANVGERHFQRELELVLPTGRDIVVVNQRGNPDLPMTPNLRWPPSAAPLDRPSTREADRAALREAVTRGQDVWTKRGVDLSGYDIINVADDVDDVRKALGYDRIILCTGSFGSQWSMAYTKRHPQAVDRLLLRGIEPLDYGYDSPAWLWNGVQRLAKVAEADAEIRKLVPAGGLIAALETVLDRLGRRPQTVTITNPRTGRPENVTVDGTTS